MRDWATGRKLKKIYKKFSTTKPTQKAYIECIHALVNLAEAKDPYTKRHSIKVSNYAVLLAKKLKLPKEEIETIKLAAILHDVGKLGIKGKVLLKGGSLNRPEYEHVKKHSEMGVEIIKPFRFFNEVILIIRHHHEKYDGSGYPDGLNGKNIPLGSRILAIADCYDALTSRRAYRKAYSSQQAMNIMKKENGSKFDSQLLDIFMSCISSGK
ncbi:MAG: HD-GYP domain-containing protein [Candidatus Omnitrophota bacterium]|nr:MAG: HD-GYP domain-containing protein [Candidatus Omnitrophota bacterium]